MYTVCYKHSMHTHIALVMKYCWYTLRRHSFISVLKTSGISSSSRVLYRSAETPIHVFNLIATSTSIVSFPSVCRPSRMMRSGWSCISLIMVSVASSCKKKYVCIYYHSVAQRQHYCNMSSSGSRGTCTSQNSSLEQAISKWEDRCLSRTLQLSKRHTN